MMIFETVPRYAERSPETCGILKSLSFHGVESSSILLRARTSQESDTVSSESFAYTHFFSTCYHGIYFAHSCLCSHPSDVTLRLTIPFARAS